MFEWRSNSNSFLTEHLPHVVLRPPEERRRGVVGRRRHVGAGRPEDVAGHSFGRPAADADEAALAADARHLVSGLAVARREHVAERREDPLEGGVGERQALGVALDPRDLETLGGGLRPPGREQLRDEVEPRDLRSSPRRGQRRVAGAAGDVEHLHPRLDAGPLRQELADVRDLLGKRRIVAGRPHRTLPLLELVEHGVHVCLLP
jgi:hypothetical protein